MPDATTIEVSKTDLYSETRIIIKMDTTIRTEIVAQTWNAARDVMDDILQKLIEDEKPKE